jgi:diaminopimelate epimerase
MNLKFIKLQTAGDDVILMDMSSKGAKKGIDYPGLAREILRRRRGAGGGSLAILEASKGYPALLRSFLPGGEEVPALNDALICAARYLFDSGRTSTESFSILGISGPREIQVLTANEFRVSLGKPVDPVSKAELAEGKGPEGRTVVETKDKRLSVTAIAFDKPYAVLFSQEADRGDLASLQRGLASLSKKGKEYGALVVRPVSRDALKLIAGRARGFDGISSAGAALAAAALAGFCEREATVQHGKGLRCADWDLKTGIVSVAASADYVFEGEWYVPEPIPAAKNQE